MTDKIEEYIKEKGLDVSGRHRELVYKKMYLGSVLRKNGYTLARIGKLFGKDHVSVLHWMRNHNNFTENKDKVYAELTQVERNMFEPEVTKKRNLMEDILKCSNTTQLTMIKNRILKGEY